MNISGKVKLINETKEYGSNGFRKREIVLTTQEQYPQNIMVEFIQDRCEILDSFSVGDFVKIDINLRGREWVNKDGETKYFNSIQGWRIEKTQNQLEAKGDLNGAIASYQAAVDIEDQNNYTEPPDWPQPIRHYLGAALLEAGRAEEAEQVYLRDLRWNQNNGWSLYGLHQALLAQGKNADAEQVKAQYESAWRYAEMDLTRSRL